jgi:hypothetical protein
VEYVTFVTDEPPLALNVDVTDIDVLPPVSELITGAASFDVPLTVEDAFAYPVREVATVTVEEVLLAIPVTVTNPVLLTVAVPPADAEAVQSNAPSKLEI